MLHLAVIHPHQGHSSILHGFPFLYQNCSSPDFPFPAAAVSVWCIKLLAKAAGCQPIRMKRQRSMLCGNGKVHGSHSLLYSLLFFIRDMNNKKPNELLTHSAAQGVFILCVRLRSFSLTSTAYVCFWHLIHH